jgi:hypothetical protein
VASLATYDNATATTKGWLSEPRHGGGKPVSVDASRLRILGHQPKSLGEEIACSAPGFTTGRRCFTGMRIIVIINFMLLPQGIIFQRDGSIPQTHGGFFIRIGAF